MSKCSCYVTYEQVSVSPSGNMHRKDIERCFGTPERDECSCKGDRSKCNFYEHIRNENKDVEMLLHNIDELITNIKNTTSIDSVKDEILLKLHNIKTSIERNKT